jgi:hypothetical protein
VPDITDNGRDRNEQCGRYPGLYSKYLHRNRQQDQSQDHAEEIRRKETGKLNQDTFPAHRGPKRYMLMKNIGIDDRQDIRQYRRRHIGDVSVREETLEEIIAKDKNEIPEDRIPDADQDKAYFLLMIQPQIMDDLFQGVLPHYYHFTRQ